MPVTAVAVTVVAVVVAMLAGLAEASQVAWRPPHSAEWRRFLLRLKSQVRGLEDAGMRRWGIEIIAQMAMATGNFTSTGFKVVPTPPDVQQMLNETLHEKLRDGEHEDCQLFGSRTGVAYYVDWKPIKELAIHGMLGLHEEWTNTSLEPVSAFGIRVYENGSTLNMHTDGIEHVVGAVVHIDRDVEEPWPLAVVGFDGRTTEIALQPGETLLYESAKLLHGRPRPLKGRWFANAFFFYKPVDSQTPDMESCAEAFAKGEHENEALTQREHGEEGDQKDFTSALVRHRVIDPSLPKLHMPGGQMLEPGCVHNWCALAADWPPTQGTNEVQSSAPWEMDLGLRLIGRRGVELHSEL